MAIARKCDRCGILFALPETGKIFGYESTRFVIPIITVGLTDKHGNQSATRYNYDLCPSCKTALLEWIEGGN